MTDPKYDLTSQTFHRYAYETYRRMRREDPVVLQPNTLDGTTVDWHVSRYDDVEAALRNPALRRHEPSHEEEAESADDETPPRIALLTARISNHMLSRDGNDHRRLRALVSQGFTPKRVIQLRTRVQEIADELLDELYPRGKMDLVNDFAFEMIALVIMGMLGIPIEDRNRFKVWTHAAMSPVLGESGAEEFADVMEGFIAYLAGLFEERRAVPRDDIITALLQAEDSGDRLSEEEVFSTLFLLVTAAQQTTMGLIGNSVLALLRNPKDLVALRDEPRLMVDAVEEFLRYDSSVERALDRYVVEDVEIGGQAIRKGEIVSLILNSANHDEAKFESPETFDIRRKPNPHLAFGKGIHHCLGAPLVRMELEIAMNTLLRRLPELRLDASEDDLRWPNTPGFRELERLPIAWKVGG